MIQVWQSSDSFGAIFATGEETLADIAEVRRAYLKPAMRVNARIGDGMKPFIKDDITSTPIGSPCSTGLGLRKWATDAVDVPFAIFHRFTDSRNVIPGG